MGISHQGTSRHRWHSAQGSKTYSSSVRWRDDTANQCSQTRPRASIRNVPAARRPGAWRGATALEPDTSWGRSERPRGHWAGEPRQPAPTAPPWLAAARRGRGPGDFLSQGGTWVDLGLVAHGSDWKALSPPSEHPVTGKEASLTAFSFCPFFLLPGCPYGQLGKDNLMLKKLIAFAKWA